MAIAKRVYEQAAQVGYKLTLLDIGGGFPGASYQGDLFREVWSSETFILRGFISSLPA